MGFAIPLCRFDDLEVFPTWNRADQFMTCSSALRLALFSRVSPNRTTAERVGRTALLGFFPPSALRVAGARFPRVCLARHLPAPGFSTLLPACFSYHLPDHFQTGNALGVHPPGLFPLVEFSCSLEQDLPPDITLRSQFGLNHQNSNALPDQLSSGPHSPQGSETPSETSFRCSSRPLPSWVFCLLRTSPPTRPAAFAADPLLSFATAPPFTVPMTPHCCKERN